MGPVHSTNIKHPGSNAEIVCLEALKNLVKLVQGISKWYYVRINVNTASNIRAQYKIRSMFETGHET